MANTLNDIFTNNLASRREWNSIGTVRAHQLVQVSTTTIPSTDGAGRLYPLFRVPAQARIVSLIPSNTADAGLTDCNVGVYPKTDWSAGDGTAISVDCLCDGEDLHLASFASGGPANRLGKGTNGLAENLFMKPLWQVAGVSADPGAGVEYDIVMQSVGDPAGCTLIWVITYTAGA